MIVLIDNTKNLKKAYMTPLLVSLLKKKNIEYKIVSDINDVNYVVDNFKKKIKGILLSGGPLCLSDDLAISLINKNITILLRLKNIPVLGVCFGFQLLCSIYGSKIVKMEEEIQGKYKLEFDNKSKLFKNMNKKEYLTYQNHKDKVLDKPNGFKIISMNENNTIEAIENEEEKIYGTQFHPEALEETSEIIYNFIDICYL